MESDATRCEAGQEHDSIGLHRSCRRIGDGIPAANPWAAKQLLKKRRRDFLKSDHVCLGKFEESPQCRRSFVEMILPEPDVVRDAHQAVIYAGIGRRGIDRPCLGPRIKPGG